MKTLLTIFTLCIISSTFATPGYGGDVGLTLVNSWQGANNLVMRIQSLKERINKSKTAFEKLEGKMNNAAHNLSDAKTDVTAAIQEVKHHIIMCNQAKQRTANAKIAERDARTYLSDTHHTFQETRKDQKETHKKLHESRDEVKEAKGDLKKAHKKFNHCNKKLLKWKSSWDAATASVKNIVDAVIDVAAAAEIKVEDLETMKTNMEKAIALEKLPSEDNFEDRIHWLKFLKTKAIYIKDTIHEKKKAKIAAAAAAAIAKANQAAANANHNVVVANP